jgi:hypothetical protein
MTLDEYVETLIPIIKALRSEKARNRRGYKKLQLWYLYRQFFYGFKEFLDDATHCKVSRRAQEEYARGGQEGNLEDMTWNDQPRFDPGRETFLLEHTYTGDMFRADIDELDDNELTVDRIAGLVRAKYFVAWILREEDNILNELGYRNERPENPFEAYRQAGIELVD